jgi:SH3-like domain-containing protein
MKRIALLIILLFFACTKTALKKEVIKPQQEVVETVQYPTAYVIKETVNLRSTPAVKSQIVTSLNDGDKVELMENKKGWYKIKTENQKIGWLRSDLVGPKNLSRTLMAAVFVDSVLPGYNVKMIFDKKKLYKIAYLIFPEKEYKNKKTLKLKAEKIGKDYQQKVYAGAVELRIMKTDEKSLFTKIKLKALAKADIAYPVLTYGRLIDLAVNPNDELTIKIAVPDSVKDNSLLKMAKNISKLYDYRIRKIEILFGRDIQDGIDFLNQPKREKNSRFCRLYYLEDDAGEYYKFNQCFE